MILTEPIQLWDDRNYVTLHSYILNNSPEFRTDQARPVAIICPVGAI